MQLDLNGMTPKQFLEQYWQKKPLVIRQGFKHFENLLSPEEMAGLACEDVVESRRVFKKNDQWQAEFGPFESYEELGETDWTLIVQALNNWVPEAEELLKCFDFIPRWRLDDVMVSYATPGGGVGPHIDLYDVFICQGSGRRRWRVGDLGPHKEFSAHPALLHTEAFDPIIDVELLPGDILYLPPGYPHDGVTLEPSMSFSVGYRTASAKDMVSAMADHIIDKDLCNDQIADPDRVISEHSGIVNNSDLERIKQQLLATLDDTLVSEFSGRYLTQSKCELDLPEESLGFQTLDVTEQLKLQPLVKLGGLRTLYFETSVADGVLYINGEQLQLSADKEALIALLCDTQELTAQDLSPWLNDDEVVEQLTHWVNAGYWYFDEIE
ncbi:cupin domain-containing protein [Shewanella sp. 1_MG-2023]|uniref:ribosomal protein uL16 3-hydroxylase n=1 Tax=unclassified Shewanella TaxID=196818 RepID=UPI0026E46EA4|nr:MULTISPECIES: cupin domain-containing protein [unclassified Shewanella]MDO6611354.1 cupin domain-containing protein [Shewanella sp. 7_MG-2023]MDO6771209.1 cupin domain-containing protein [Shewanella sp. 2_MG-2023]MDO6795450.1 cupin domain-containing protein [Shewanella sp. 1_MG-2023]